MLYETFNKTSERTRTSSEGHAGAQGCARAPAKELGAGPVRPRRPTARLTVALSRKRRTTKDQTELVSRSVAFVPISSNNSVTKLWLQLD